MARVGSLDLSSDGSTTAAGVLDPVRGCAYLGLWTSRVVKVALGTGKALPGRVGHVNFEPGQSPSHSAVIDLAAGYAYFGHNAGTVGLLTKVALGTGDDPPTLVGSLSLPGEYNLNYGAIDPASGTAYFVAAGQHKVMKVALGAGNSLPTRIGAATFEADETVLAPMVIDPASGYGFVGSHNPVDKVVKFSLGSGQDPPARVGALTLESNEVNLQCGFLYEGYLYFGTYGPNASPGRIVKVAPGAGNAPPTRVGSIALEPGEERITRAALDPACGIAWFIFYTQPNPGRVVRVSLRGELPRRLDALTLEPGEKSQLWYLLADNAAGHLYLALNASRLKVSVAPSCSAPVRTGALVFEAPRAFISAAMDQTTGYAYFGTHSSPGRITKIAPGDGSQSPVLAGESVLNPGEGSVTSAVVDPSAGMGYFGVAPAKVVKVALGAGSAPPTRVGVAVISAGALRGHRPDRRVRAFRDLQWRLLGGGQGLHGRAGVAPGSGGGSAPGP